MGHGDALHLADMDPDRPGLELWQPYESPADNGRVGAALIDARTGARLFTVPENSADVGRGVAANVDPRYRGNEAWAARGGLNTATGVQIGTIKPSQNFASWWDADFTRELLDGITIAKWDYNTNTLVPLLVATDAASNNGTKATPGLSADILGDWREEVIFRTTDNNNLRIYTTTTYTTHRLYTLMHDPQYRVAIAWQNSAYNQPPHPSFYIGEDMAPAPVQNIEYVTDLIPPVALAKNISVTLSGGVASILPEDVDNGSYDAFDIQSLALSDSTFDCTNIGENQVTLIVTDNNGNVSTAVATVTVIGEIPVAPLIVVSRTDNTYTGGNANTVFLGYGAQQLTLTASNSNAGINYLWSPSTYLSNPAIANPVFQPTAAGTHNYTVTGTNGYGCTASSPVTLLVIDARCGNNNNKVLICKKGKDQCVAAPSVHAHLANGSSLGSCEIGTNANTIVRSGEQLFEKTVLGVNPNPATSASRVVIHPSKSEKYELCIYDMKGSRIALIGRGELQANISMVHQLQINNFTKGTYVIKLVTDSDVLIQKIIIQ